MTTWDAGFEASPADGDEHKYGAQKIRELKAAISERLDLEHNFKAGGQPSHKAGLCAVVYYGTTTQINALSLPIAGGVAYDTTLAVWKVYVQGQGWVVVGQQIPAATKMLFCQAAAPTGWTQDVALNDRVLRVVSGAGAGTGGNWTLSGLVTAGHVLTVQEMPAHTHGNVYIAPTVAPMIGGGGGPTCPATAGVTSSVGSGNAHTHDMDNTGNWRPSYVDVIACTKN